jgi:putative aldouronate transport system substrate-binding protein
VKGKHWVFTDEAAGVVGFPTGTSAANSKWNPNTDWMFGNQFNAYYRDSYDAKQKRWQAEAEVNKTAVTSKAIGFAMDISPVKTQVATISAAIGQYRPQVINGLADPDKSLSNLLKRMDGAGMNKLMTEAQTQLDAFRNGR